MEYPTPKWKEKAKEVNTDADLKADSFLDDMKRSKWTGAILLGSVVAVIISIVLWLLP